MSARCSRDSICSRVRGLCLRDIGIPAFGCGGRPSTTRSRAGIQRGRESFKKSGAVAGGGKNPEFPVPAAPALGGYGGMDPPEDDRLLDRLRAGDPAAVADLFARHRDRLRRMVDMRLDRRLQGRVDASDVIQEAHLEVAGRLADYLKDPRLPPFLWLRLVVGERL